jgi:hypothetical protein
MFGGSDGVLKNDLWWYDPGTNTWEMKTPTGDLPSVRRGHSMVWDPARSGMIMFDGYGTSPYYKNDLWWYDPELNSWTQVTPTGSSPSARSFHSIVWDGQKVIMFGGYDNCGYKNDLWWYDPELNSWTQVTPTGSSPSARAYHSMVWDPDVTSGRVIMFGGNGVSGYKNDLWWYDPVSNTWTEKIAQGTTGSPSVRQMHSMVWDPARSGMIMFGGYADYGYKNDLWWYDSVANTWTEKTPDNSPSARYGHSMVWDPARSGMIMFGGYNDSGNKNDLWWYDPELNTWTEKIAQGITGSPSVRYGHSMFWYPDVTSGRVIMFGGSDDYSNKNDLWWYDPALNTWTGPIVISGSPSARSFHSIVWDGQKVIMFGGYDGAVNKNDLWWW